MKPSKKQKQITAELLSGVLHQLGELNVNYALIIEGCDTVFTNSSVGHAVSIMRDSVQLQDKIYETRIERLAEKRLTFLMSKTNLPMWVVSLVWGASVSISETGWRIFNLQR